MRFVLRTSRGLAAGVVAAVLATPASIAAQAPAPDGSPLCGSEAGSESTTGDDSPLRIATYNILHSRDDYADETLDARVDLIVGELAASGADVVGLQEVVRSGRHGNVAQRVAAGLAQRTGDDWAWCFFQSNPHVAGESDTEPGGAGGPVSRQIADLSRKGDKPWSEGLAILSRLGMADARAHRLPPRTAEVQACTAENPGDPLAGPTCQLDTRQILWARVPTECGFLDVYDTHLVHTVSSLSEDVRFTQVTDALVQIDATASPGPLPDVLIGDFNTSEGSPVWQAVIDAGFVDTFRRAAPDDPGLTSDQEIAEPFSTVGSRIDYVFTRTGEAAMTPRDAQVIGVAPTPFEGSSGQTVVWPSDHYGVAVTLDVAGACAASSGETDGDADTRTDAGRRGEAEGRRSTWLFAIAGLAILAAVVVLMVSRRSKHASSVSPHP